jgi:sec-independent protein translocase protein TatA
VLAGFGPTELIIVLVIVLLIFGPKRLPGLGRSVGGALREFKESVTGRDDDDEAATPELEDRRRATAAVGHPEHEAGVTQGEPARERTPHS